MDKVKDLTMQAFTYFYNSLIQDYYLKFTDYRVFLT